MQRLSGTQLTIVLCVATVTVGVLISTGKIVVTAELLDRIIFALTAYMTGLVQERPDALRKMLGIPDSEKKK